MHPIGVDMSKRTFHVAFDERTVSIFQNTEAGIDRFLATLRSVTVDANSVTIGVEATGAYHLLLCTRARAAGWRIVVINPLETHYVVKAQSLRKLKTDRKDALVIREMVPLGHGYLYTDTDRVLALKALLVDREGLVAMATSVKQRMEAHSVKQRAATTVLHDGFPPVLIALRKEIRRIERRFTQYEPDAQRLLRSIPGIGVLTAAALVGFIGDINRFSSPEKLVAYIGLDCRVKESGTSVKGKGFLTKCGNAHLRGVLFNAAFVARQKNPDLKTYFEKKIGEGKHYFSAMCAVERKLVHLIYAVWKRGSPFEQEFMPSKSMHLGLQSKPESAGNHLDNATFCTTD